MAVNASHRVVYELTCLSVGHGVDRLKALEGIAVASLAVGDEHRGMAVEAGARLLDNPLPPGEGLILKHVGVGPLLAEVYSKGIACPYCLKPGILFKTRL